MPATPPVDMSSQVKAALAMNAALTSHGYKKADMPLYMAFQRAAGLGVDGMPGTGTMTKLAQVLTTAGSPLASVRLYKFTGGFNGVDAPTAQEWIGDPQWAGPPPAIAQAGNPIEVINAKDTPTASQVAAVTPMAPTTPIVTAQDVQRALNQLGIAKPLLVADGKIGPLSKAAILAFQKKAGLTADGIAGPQTKAALQDAIAKMG